jgi:CBS domain-containing protein
MGCGGTGSPAALRLAFDPVALATQPTPLLPQAVSALQHEKNRGLLENALYFFAFQVIRIAIFKTPSRRDSKSSQAFPMSSGAKVCVRSGVSSQPPGYRQDGKLVGDISVRDIVLRAEPNSGVPRKEVVATTKAIRSKTDQNQNGPPAGA